MKRKPLSVRSLTKIALLSAVAGVLMLFEIPLWFAPNFYQLDLSELAVMIGALSMGPLAGMFIELIKILLNFVMNGTITGGVGEAANFIIGCSFVLPATWLYQRKKDKKGMLFGFAAGIVGLVIVGAIANYFVLLPVYAAVFGQPLEAFIAMGHVLNPLIVDLPTFTLYAVVPFNLLKGVVVSVLTYFLYPKLKAAIE